MTLLSICQNAADEIGIDRPESVVGNTDPDVEKLYRYANKVGNNLMKVYAWQPLRKGHTFTSISGYEQTGILPDDFDRIVPETFWNRTTTINVSGPVSDVQWETFLALTTAPPLNQSYFIYSGNLIQVYPNPGAGQTLAFRYVRNTWAIDGTSGNPKTSFTLDTDTTYLDEELITDGVVYEYNANDGLPFQKALSSFEQRFNTMIENDQPSSTVMQAADIFGRYSRHPSGAPGPNQALTGWWV